MVQSKTVITICIAALTSSITLADLPAHFDWRDVDGENWMTGVREQGLCASCWAFAAVGTVEAQFNIFFDWPDYDIELSEEHLIAVYPPVQGCFSRYNCQTGGWHNATLEFIRDSGITDEECFPYVDLTCSGDVCGCDHGCTNAECSDRCDEWNIRLWKIDDVEYVDTTEEAIKNYIYNVGPLAVGMSTNGDFDDETGIWICNSPGCNHFVVLVGWDDPGSYWICKNSLGVGWDPWSPDGYFKVAFGNCGIEDYPCGAILNNPDVDKLYVQNSSGDTVAWFGDLGNIVLKGILTSGGACSAPAGSFIIENSEGETVSYVDNQGNLCVEGTWSEQCGSCEPATDAFIIKDSSGTNVSYIDFDGNLCLTGKLYQHPNPPNP
jgi:C1A family cysteine protease